MKTHDNLKLPIPHPNKTIQDITTPPPSTQIAIYFVQKHNIYNIKERI